MSTLLAIIFSCGPGISFSTSLRALQPILKELQDPNKLHQTVNCSGQLSRKNGLIDLKENKPQQHCQKYIESVTQKKEDKNV